MNQAQTATFEICKRGCLLLFLLGTAFQVRAGSPYNWTGVIVQTWEAESGTLIAPMAIGGTAPTYIYSPYNGNGANPPGPCSTQGCASYTFIPCVSGAYKIEVYVKAPTSSDDSLYAGIVGLNDIWPGTPGDLKRWDIDQSAGNNYAWRYVTDWNNINTQANARVWMLTAGVTYTLRLEGRENGVLVDQLRIRRDPALSCGTPTPTRTPTPLPGSPTISPTFSNTPTITLTPVATPTPVPTTYQGLEASERLYGMEYIPLPPVSSGGTNFYDLAMTFTTLAANTVPKNTARWRIVLSPSIASLGTQIQVETRIGPYGVTCTSGYLASVTWSASSLPLPSRPSNCSITYFWLNAGSPPITERYDVMGDPRYTPYRDVLGLPAGQKFADNYNWFFKNLGDTTHPDYRAVYPALLPMADFHLYNNQVNTDVPKQFRLWREAVVRSRSIYTSMTGYNSYYVGIGGEIGGDAANKLTGGVPMNSGPWGAAGTLDRDEITGSVPLIQNTDNTWRSLPFIGELWPDSAYVSDWSSTGTMSSWGNLRNSVSGGSWRRNGWENCDTASWTWLRVLHRTQTLGCATFLNGNGGSGTFNHYFQTLNASLAKDGQATSLSYHFPMPATFNVNRPWGLNAGGNTPPEWSLPPYPGSRLALDVYSASTQSANVTGFYLRDTVSNATDRSSAAIRGLDSAMAAVDPSQAVGWFIVNGLAPSTDTGINFVAEFSLLTCLRTFHDAGAPTAAAGSFSNLKNKIGSNTYRIEPVPRVEILYPNPTTDTRNLSLIPIIWSERYARWDGKQYTENYPCLDVNGNPATGGDGSISRVTMTWCTDSDPTAPPNPNLEWHSSEPLAFNVKYSDDNGATWRTATTPSITCTAGVYLSEAPHSLTYPASAHTFTWIWDVSSLPVGNKKFRIECYRLNLKQHYAYHETSIFTNP